MHPQDLIRGAATLLCVEYDRVATMREAELEELAAEGLVRSVELGERAYALAIECLQHAPDVA